MATRKRTGIQSVLSDRHPAPPSLTRWLTENQLEIEISAYLYLLNAIAQRWVPIAITHQKDCLSHRLQFDGLFNASRATKDDSFYCCPVISLCCNKLIPALHGIIRAVQHDITKLNHSIRTIFGIPSTLAKVTRLMTGSVPVLTT